jgi:hypothetical protein
MILIRFLNSGQSIGISLIWLSIIFQILFP